MLQSGLYGPEVRVSAHRITSESSFVFRATTGNSIFRTGFCLSLSGQQSLFTVATDYCEAGKIRLATPEWLVSEEHHGGSYVIASVHTQRKSFSLEDRFLVRPSFCYNDRIALWFKRISRWQRGIIYVFVKLLTFGSGIFPATYTLTTIWLRFRRIGPKGSEVWFVGNWPFSYVHRCPIDSNLVSNLRKV